jgi:transposase
VKTPSARFIPVDRQQCVLRPLDVEAMIADDHVARTLWRFLGTLDLSRFLESPKAVEGHAGRPGWEPRLLIAVWLYGLMRGVSSARALARETAYEPGLQWLTGLQEINHHSLSDLRVNHGAALDEVFAQVLGVLHRHELITLERVTQDGTKVRADVDKSTVGRRDALEKHLELARRHVAEMNQQAAEQEQITQRQKAARQRAGREREQKLQEALDTIDRLQKERTQDKRKPCQSSPTDPDAQFMRTGDHGLAPCHNVQLSCDAANKVIVSVAITSDPSDAHQLTPALDRNRKSVFTTARTNDRRWRLYQSQKCNDGGGARRGFLWQLASVGRSTAGARHCRGISHRGLSLRPNAACDGLPARPRASANSRYRFGRPSASASVRRVARRLSNLSCA